MEAGQCRMSRRAARPLSCHYPDAERCEVLFPYKAVNTDELDLLPGQVSPDWWRAAHVTTVLASDWSMCRW